LYQETLNWLRSKSPTQLVTLTPEELYILLKNLRHVFSEGDTSKYLVPDDALKSFLHHCSQTIGDAYFRTPRNTIKAFLDILAVLDQNPTMKWSQLVESINIEEDRPSDTDEIIVDKETREIMTSDGLADFKL